MPEQVPLKSEVSEVESATVRMPPVALMAQATLGPVRVPLMAVASEAEPAVGLLLLLLERPWRLRAGWGPVRCDGTRAVGSLSLAECRCWMPTPVTAWGL